MRKFCPKDCPFLHPTEAQQDLFYKMHSFRPFHDCTKLKKTVGHRGNHPRLVKICDIGFPAGVED